jgi:2-amino-4-hydroxy-6-hydroxymethyldihydropteridine diphosphokinase
MDRAWLALGSNLGERIDYLRQAVAALRAEGVLVARCSSVYETVPVGAPEQPHFLNAVVEIIWRESPTNLLALCQRIEHDADRVREVKWGPRTLDIDIIAIDDVVQPDDEVLQVPHPRAHDRAFVLVPLAEIAPDVPLEPYGTAQSLLRALPPAATADVRFTTLRLDS